MLYRCFELLDSGGGLNLTGAEGKETAELGEAAEESTANVAVGSIHFTKKGEKGIVRDDVVQQWLEQH